MYGVMEATVFSADSLKDFITCVCQKESGSNIPPVLGEGNIYGLPGRFLCSSIIRSTACCETGRTRMELWVLG